MANEISATIIADSVNSAGDRITSMVLVFPRIILAEFNTHRMFSRNSASSRAIPFAKMIKSVQDDPFIPIKWMKEHTGMQGNEYFTEDKDVNGLRNGWICARDSAVKEAKYMSGLGLTKQLCNRIIEPYSWHTVIMTATEFWNFFNLRMNEAAEIHMRELALCMYRAYYKSIPKQLNDGEWHIPFGDKFNHGKLKLLMPIIHPYSVDEYHRVFEKLMVKIATARCARVSYLNFEGKDDYDEDIKLHNRLKQNGHFSPFEHCAQADQSCKQSGNFKGFIQYRKTLNNENNTKPF